MWPCNGVEVDRSGFEVDSKYRKLGQTPPLLAARIGMREL